MKNVPSFSVAQFKDFPFMVIFLSLWHVCCLKNISLVQCNEDILLYPKVLLFAFIFWELIFCLAGGTSQVSFFPQGYPTDSAPFT